MLTVSRNRSLGITLVILAAVLWGTTGTVQALLPPAREPIVVAATRLCIGALSLLLLACGARRSRAAFRNLPLGAVLGAGAAIATFNVMFFVAISGAGIGIGTALAIGGAPIWVTLYEIVVQHKLPGRTRLLGQAICIMGAVLLVLSGGETDASAGGIVLAALAGSAYATYSVITGRIGHLAPATTIAAATFTVAAILLAPALFLLPTAWLAEPGVMSKMIYLGVVTTGIAYVLYTWGLRHVAASTGVTLSLAEPLTAWLLATLVIGEAASTIKVTGAVLLLAGLIVVTRSGASSAIAETGDGTDSPARS